MLKYRNTPTVVDNIRFQSKRESVRYSELKILERAGVISDLTLQPSFDICPSVKWNGKTLRKLRYIADFQYTENNKIVVEDSKGYRTKSYIIKRSLFLTQYPEYLFREV